MKIKRNTLFWIVTCSGILSALSGMFIAEIMKLIWPMWIGIVIAVILLFIQMAIMDRELNEIE